MPIYKAPVKDMLFVLNDVWNMPNLCQTIPTYEAVDPELVESVLIEAAKFNENILQPLNQSGDREGCRFENGKVFTPKGFKEAYQQYIEAGWLSVSSPTEYGGQGLPKMLQVFIDEMLASSNVSFSLYCVLTQGAAHALELHATDELKQRYLTKLVSGVWGGTMCLTEPHCGTDLSLVRTKAEPKNDGSYNLSGVKIFITSGEHDLTENIIHTVLARLPDAPPGIKGLSLFLVPKYLVNQQGQLGERNPVFCGSIEHKMGIRGSSTCVINFDGAKGYLIGEKHQGMRAMFDMMNLERINIGIEGLGLAEVSYQNALQYAKERLQGRAATGPQHPEKAADPLIVHADIRRMLMTMKACNEGLRAFFAWLGMQVDISDHHSNADLRKQAEGFVALFTPIAKAYTTDYGSEACNLGLQILGGHGYVQEWGMEQFIRDARIAQIYEGTNGVQALDLVKRKVIMNKGSDVHAFAHLINNFIEQENSEASLRDFLPRLKTVTEIWAALAETIIEKSQKNPNEIGAVSVDYLKLTGLVALAYQWAMMVKAAAPKAAADTFYATKIKTAHFFFQRVLAEVETLQARIFAGAESTMALKDSEF